MDGNLASGSASSRFVSETQLSEAQKKREEEIRASYARIGQDVPEDVLKSLTAKDETYDPRSLYEKLQAHKDAKQEAWDEKHKLGNQFRGLDPEESSFLADVAKQQRQEQHRKELETRKELDDFRKAALAARDASPPSITALASQTQGPKASVATSAAPHNVPSSASASTSSKAKAAKRRREGLLGIVKKKTPVGPAQSGSATQDQAKDTTQSGNLDDAHDAASKNSSQSDGIEKQAKRTKSTSNADT